MPVAVTFLEQGKQAPAQIAGQLAEFLNAAKTSLHIAIYDFRLGEITAGAVRVGALRSRPPPAWTCASSMTPASRTRRFRESAPTPLLRNGRLRSPNRRQGPIEKRSPAAIRKCQN